VLIVDEDTIRPGQTVTVRGAIQQLLAGLAPADRVALVTVPFGGLTVDLTTDHSRIIEGVGAVTAKSPRGETTADAQCRTLNTLGAMTDTLLRLSGVEDPVTVVLFSSHQEPPPSIIRSTGGAAPVASPCDLRSSDFTDLGTSAARAQARFFVVHADLDQRGRGLAGLEHVTGVTGGPLLFLATADGRTAIDRILSDSSGHFIARVERRPDDRPGNAVPVAVQVSRPNTTVWRGPTLFVTRPPVHAGTPGPISTLDLMRHPTLTRDLPLRIAAHAFRADTAGQLRIAVTLDSPATGVVLSAAMVGAFDEAGQLVAGLEMSADALANQPTTAAMLVPEGRYRLRVAAVDSTGRGGSADLGLDAHLTSIGGLRASDVMVGLSRAGAFVPTLEYLDEPTAFAMLEVYASQMLPVRAVFEVASTLNGPALKTMPGLVEQTPDASRIIVTSVLPIADLPPGDYVVRAILTPEGQPSGRVVSALRKVAR
jgi:hypothetical protein